ncbi:glycoside hydrolase family 43 protein [Paenibacillus sp. NPDC057886]|uniref:glycoside hydrolase family 43 protein n=1 Tax=Paenibacillus sp. NPDC057886 TaxID=3346270 RepID=UPI003678B46D
MNMSSVKKAIGKLPRNGNPLMSHKFGADPYALVYGERVYIFMTGDRLEYDEQGRPQPNSYKSINRIAVISSDDLVNWTDHSYIQVAGPDGAAQWASQSWAPAAVHKIIDNQDRFFLYFANNASGIGVLSADSPLGPWVDPIGEALITRATPGVENVTWLFDPAVLVDEDGKGYIYFGGGVPENQYENPGTARVMALSDDMVHVQGKAETIPAPYMFEDAGIHKFEGTYYYTYCSNFYDGIRAEGSPPAGEIAYMTSDKPMGPWVYQGTILKNPGHFFGVSGNNHHAIFSFQNNWYIAYHAQTLSQFLDIPEGYRSTHLNRLYHEEDGSIRDVNADYRGVEQAKWFNPYHWTTVPTIGWSSGVKTERTTEAEVEVGKGSDAPVTVMKRGDWIAIAAANLDIQSASRFRAIISNGDFEGVLELRMDQKDGELIGELPIPAAQSQDSWTEQVAAVEGGQGIHDLYLVAGSSSEQFEIRLKAWVIEGANSTE